jgi:hypothetical protein
MMELFCLLSSMQENTNINRMMLHSHIYAFIDVNNDSAMYNVYICVFWRTTREVLLVGNPNNI